MAASADWPAWRVPIHRRLRLVQAGVGVHGVARRRETYRLPGLWCLHLYRYTGTLEVAGVAMPIRPGHASVVPAGTTMRFTYRGRSAHLYAHFAFGRERGGAANAATTATVPAMQDLGPRFDALADHFHAALSWTTDQPGRAAVRVWDVLWSLVDPAAAPDGPGAAPPLHPACADAVRRIEAGLARPLDLAALAAAVGVSHNHLIRLFHRHHGQTIAGYVRGRRVRLARHLLEQTTLPIKAVAASVGLPDLQQFNKVIRRALGQPPRRLRAAAGAHLRPG